MITGIDYMYQSLSKSIHEELKKVVKGGVYVSIDNEKDEILVDIANGDLRWEWVGHNFSDIINDANARTIARYVTKRYRAALEKQFFTGKKEVRNGGGTDVTRIADQDSGIKMDFKKN